MSDAETRAIQQTLDKNAAPLAREWVYAASPATVLAACAQVLASFGNHSIKQAAPDHIEAVKDRAQEFEKKLEALIRQEKAIAPSVLLACATAIYEIAVRLEETP